MDTWSELSTLTNSLTETICTISSATKPDVSMLEGIFTKFREINENKVKLLEAIWARYISCNDLQVETEAWSAIVLESQQNF